MVLQMENIFLNLRRIFKINNGKEWFVSHYLFRKRFKLEEGKCRADLKPQGFFQLLISESIV